MMISCDDESNHWNFQYFEVLCIMGFIVLKHLKTAYADRKTDFVHCARQYWYVPIVR
jgi:hypothetical protein